MSRSLTRQERWRATVKKTHGEVMQNAAFSRIFLVSTKQKIFWTVLSPVILSFCFRDIQPNGFGVQSLKGCFADSNADVLLMHGTVSLVRFLNYLKAAMYRRTFFKIYL